jgi:hypothetical protein
MSGQREQRSRKRPPLGVVALTVAALCWSCAGTTISESATPGASPAVSSEPGLPTSIAASPSLVAVPSEVATPSPPGETATPTAQPDVSVRFLASVPTKHWGDPPFKVKAEASNKAHLAYAAAGQCSVGRKDGLVAVKAVGTCKITASTTSEPAAKVSLDFAIQRAHPKIKFKDRAIRFTRPFAYKPAATVKPSIPLHFQGIKQGAFDECVVENNRLTFTNAEPDLPADCVIEVSAAQTSDQYFAPATVRATIHVDVPDWHVDAIDPDTVHFDATDPTVTVTVRETSGDAFGIEVEDSGECTVKSISPPDPSPPGTTTYLVVVSLAPPPAGGYTCQMHTAAAPADYLGPGGTDDIHVTVVP